MLDVSNVVFAFRPNMTYSESLISYVQLRTQIKTVPGVVQGRILIRILIREHVARRTSE